MLYFSIIIAVAITKNYDFTFLLPYIFSPLQLQGNPHATVTRTKSAPIRRTTLPAGSPSPFGMQPPSQLDSQFLGEPEIMNRTETLCLSVTELALGGRLCLMSFKA